jgi:hypothetical protein
MNMFQRSARATLPLPGLMTITDARHNCHARRWDILPRRGLATDS